MEPHNLYIATLKTFKQQKNCERTRPLNVAIYFGNICRTEAKRDLECLAAV